MALKLGEAFLLLFVDKKGLATQMKGAKDAFAKQMAGMQAIANKARLALMIGAGIGALVVREAAGLEQGMSRVKALTGATAEEMAALEAQARELGRGTVFSAGQAAEAMGTFALAGFKVNQILQAMGPTLDLAAAGEIGVAQAADIAAKVMAGMGIEAADFGRAADVLAKAATTATTDLTMLAEAMKFAGPMAKSSGKSLEETMSIIMALSNAGMQASQAGNILKNSLARLSGSTKELNDVFAELQVEAVGADGALRPMADIVDDLNAALKDTGEAEAAAKVMRAFGLRAGPGMLEMLSVGGDAIRRFETLLQEAGGTAAKVASEKLDNLIGTLKKLKSETSELAVVFGSELIPELREATEKITAWTKKLSESDDATVKQTLATFKFLAAWAAVLVILPKLYAGVAGIGTLLTTRFALGMAAGTAGLGLLAAAFIHSKTTGDSFAESMRAVAQSLLGVKSAAAEAEEAIKRTPRVRKQEWFQKEEEARGLDTGYGKPVTMDQLATAQAAVSAMNRRYEDLGRLIDAQEKRLMEATEPTLGRRVDVLVGGGRGVASAVSRAQTERDILAGMVKEHQLLPGARGQAEQRLERLQLNWALGPKLRPRPLPPLHEIEGGAAPAVKPGLVDLQGEVDRMITRARREMEGRRWGLETMNLPMAQEKVERLGQRQERMGLAPRGTEHYGLAEYAKAIQSSIKGPEKERWSRLEGRLDRANKMLEKINQSVKEVDPPGYML